MISRNKAIAVIVAVVLMGAVMIVGLILFAISLTPDAEVAEGETVARTLPVVTSPAPDAEDVTLPESTYEPAQEVQEYYYTAEDLELVQAALIFELVGRWNFIYAANQPTTPYGALPETVEFFPDGTGKNHHPLSVEPQAFTWRAENDRVLTTGATLPFFYFRIDEPRIVFIYDWGANFYSVFLRDGYMLP